MPEKDGKLTADETQIAVEKLRELEIKHHDGDLRCEVCRSSLWVLHPFVLSRHSDRDTANIASWRLPSVAFICTSCGNTKSFFAPAMGISPQNSMSREDYVAMQAVAEKEAEAEGKDNGS